MLRHQMFTALTNAIGAVCVSISNRCILGLTGSRTAGLMGRIQIESSMLDFKPRLDVLAFEYDNKTCTAASYVDNLYFTGHGVSGATRNADVFGEYLKAKWGQRFKDGSRTVLPANGCPFVQPASESWSVVCQDVVLGWTLVDNGNPRPNWMSTKTKMWRAFYSQLRRPRWHKLGVQRRLVILYRCIMLVFLRNCCCPILRALAKRNGHPITLDGCCLYAGAKGSK
eukprot:TRINITY_DN41679_c0_g1_i1.p1 TRINITY_DN41679_c0_g1~~TRINITY_DN41679_c0_g1_i1.p1  ORF type:complete len:226 (-),score=17.69 TRINITY_DN41679_c0_g1_i1:97-774(-)